MMNPSDKAKRKRQEAIGESFKQNLQAIDWKDDTTIPTVDISAIRRRVCEKIPFYTEALTRIDIRFVENKPDAPSMAWTDGYRIYISLRHTEAYSKAVLSNGGKWFASKELATIFFMLHELGHIVLQTFERKRTREMRLWNIATDEKINEFTVGLMRDSGMFRSEQSLKDFMEVITDNFILDPGKYGDFTAEEVHADMYQIEVSMGGGGSNGGANSGDMVGNGTPDKDENGDELSPTEKMARDILHHEMAGYSERNASKMPGNGTCGREMDFIAQPPPVLMSDVLRKLPRTIMKEDWGFGSRASRIDRFLPKGYRAPIQMPCHPDKIQCLCFVLDMSGSMSGEQLNTCINIVREAQSYAGKIYLICHTSEICYSSWIDSYSDVPRDISGGTAFRPVLDELRRLEEVGNDGKKFLFNGILWSTDLYGEINPHNSDFYRDQSKRLRWLISGSREVPNAATHHTWYIDEIA